MLFNELRKKMLLPEREILIDKIVRIRGIDTHLISLTLQENRITLWAMHQAPCYVDEKGYMYERIEYASKREEMITNYKEIPNHLAHISEITIENQKIEFTSSRTSRIPDMDGEGYMLLQHFVEIGLNINPWGNTDINNMVVVAFEYDGGEGFPSIDLSKELDISLKVSRDFKQILINELLYLNFGEAEKGRKLHFYDSNELKDRFVYIDGIKHFDIWEVTRIRLEDSQNLSLPPEQVWKMKEQYLSCVENICPKGMDLAVLEYETEGDIQLNFYSKEYLDAKPVRNTSPIPGVMIASSNKFGINGLRSRMCIIKPVEKDFNGGIDIELFSWMMEIPEEIIRI